ncbi:GNAT family N-acetyltransferase [Streptomyces sp. SID8379]|uniref:GNAT family N-acetyltransferase n=1 Tax=unclassified Streptomyces TaxID=2593676 RepID=UPI0003792F98|nr:MULTISPECIES: GNAT family N-acetyltransferase [unclassified Streptomyces]MYW67523.1 GNAT family N-acetyltransferase [Streptomyces sp. SID8379]
MDHVRDWVDGWVVSRGAAPPLVEPWGYTILVGRFTAVGRHVFGATGDDVREDDVRKVTEATRGINTHLKVFADRERVLPWLGAGWEPYGSDDFLMATELTREPEPEIPSGYHLHTWSRGGVVQVVLTDDDGTLAARGQVAPTGASAVVDQIETSEDHRRKGLGSVVMRTLHAAARAQGATRAVLACTPEGRLLYEAVGWRIVAPLTNAKYVGV